MILFICHPITILFTIFFMLMNEQIREIMIKRKTLRRTKMKHEVKECLSIVDKYSKEMTDMMYIDLCNSLLTIYQEIEET